MSCNSCSKPFSILRKEKGCPGCGFSYCSKCLQYKTFLQKINSETKVCAKCQQAKQSTEPPPPPPDIYYKRMGIIVPDKNKIATKFINSEVEENYKDQEILGRLQKLKEDSKVATKGPLEEEIARRLQKIKNEMPSSSDDELNKRLAKLKGIPSTVAYSKAALPAPDVRSEQQQADDLIRQYLEQTKIDNNYKDEFDSLVSNIESRLQKLKGSSVPASDSDAQHISVTPDSEDEDETVRKIIEKAKAEVSLEDEISSQTNEELPFCEICNEDAKMRCLGCRYLFCKRCFMEHKDDDDGCDRYEPYTPPKSGKI